jgi:hypothetical protein
VVAREVRAPRERPPVGVALVERADDEVQEVAQAVGHGSDIFALKA